MFTALKGELRDDGYYHTIRDLVQIREEDAGYDVGDTDSDEE